MIFQHGALYRPSKYIKKNSILYKILIKIKRDYYHAKVGLAPSITITIITKNKNVIWYIPFSKCMRIIFSQ